MAHRFILVCPFCKTTSNKLSEHLANSKCGVGKSKDERKVIVDNAKTSAACFLEKQVMEDTYLSDLWVESGGKVESFEAFTAALSSLGVYVKTAERVQKSKSTSSVGPCKVLFPEVSEQSKEQEFQSAAIEVESNGSTDSREVQEVDSEEDVGVTQDVGHDEWLHEPPKEYVPSKRTAMQREGLYDFFKGEHEILSAYMAYRLSKNKSPQDTRNRMAQINRILHFVQTSPDNPDPVEPRVEALLDANRVHDFVETAQTCGVKFSTLIKMYSTLVTFVDFLLEVKDYQTSDVQLFDGLTLIRAQCMDKIKELRQDLAHEKRTAEDVSDQYRNVLSNLKIVNDSQHRDEMLAILESQRFPMKSKYRTKVVPKNIIGDYINVTRYCMGQMVLGQFSKPSLLEKLTLADFLGARIVNDLYVVPMDDGNAHCLLTEEQYSLLKLWYKNARVEVSEDDNPSTSKFFRRFDGKPCTYCYRDIQAFAKHYNIVQMTPSEIVKAAKQKAWSDNERPMVEYYLDFVQDPKIRFTDDGLLNLTNGCKIFHNHFSTKRSHPGPVQTGKRRSSHNDDFENVLRDFPLNSRCPTIGQAKQFVAEECEDSNKRAKQLIAQWRYAYARDGIANWLEAQRTCPSLEQYQSHAMKNNWGKVFDYEHVKRAFVAKTPRKENKETPWTDATAFAMADSQNWPGLAIIRNPQIGRGLITTKSFKQNDIVCDYHGVYYDRKETQEKDAQYKAGEIDGSYMYFFEHSKKQYCVDAIAEDNTLGRLINHSSLHPNVKPTVLQHEGKIRLFFTARVDIDKSTELFFDYGDRSSKADFMKKKAPCICPACRAKTEQKRKAKSQSGGASKKSK